MFVLVMTKTDNCWFGWS